MNSDEINDMVDEVYSGHSDEPIKTFPASYKTSDGWEFNYLMDDKTEEDLYQRFNVHDVHPDQTRRMQAMREEGHNLARMMSGMAPKSRELSLALTNLEQAVMWCNKAIAAERQEPEKRVKDLTTAPKEGVNR